MGLSDNFCVKWDDFEANITERFHELRENSEHFDVTLCCDNGTDTLPAHKVILAACSPLFRKILYHQKDHQNLFLYLKGIHIKELQAVLDFMYLGRVNVVQDSLNDFLDAAEELAIKGLKKNSKPENLVSKDKATKGNSYLPPVLDFTPKAAKRLESNDNVNTFQLLEDPFKTKSEPEPSQLESKSENENKMDNADDDMKHVDGFNNSYFVPFDGFNQPGDGNQFDDSLVSVDSLLVQNQFDDSLESKDDLLAGIPRSSLEGFHEEARSMAGSPSEGIKVKKKKKHNTIEQQLEIVRRFENGEKSTRIGRDLGLPESTVRDIIKRREKLKKIKNVNQAFGPSSSESQIRTRSPALETMERLLVNWIENCNKQEVSVDMNMIMAKARDFYQKIRNKQEFSDMTQTELKESFNASRGWFNRFKKRTGISLQRPLDDQSGTISKQTWTAKKN